MINNYDIYCLSFNNLKRRTAMENRFKQLDIKCSFYDGVDSNDPRIFNNNGFGAWSCMLGHIDMIKNFYENSEKEYGIFCEDDIFIHKDFNKLIPDIIEDFKLMELDVLLLGYLIPFKISSQYNGFEFKSMNNDLNNNSNNDLKYVYHNYPNDLWGAQMYMLTKKHAKYLLDNYNIEYAIRTLTDNTLQPFSSDWTITKEGNRALIYPMLAVETADKKSGHQGQDIFHENCKNMNYDPNMYI
jgi:GR25 family glycosyltransferase involved in LPS biosynthesis